MSECNCTMSIINILLSRPFDYITTLCRFTFDQIKLFSFVLSVGGTRIKIYLSYFIGNKLLYPKRTKQI